MCKRIHEPASERRRRLEKICSHEKQPHPETMLNLVLEKICLHEKQPHPETMLKNDAENPFLIDYHG